MGLTAAHELLRKGFDVTIFEKDDRVGGMSASFDFDGLKIERYYHFFCKPDAPVFEMLAEFGLSGRLKWVETKMGFFYRGELFKWGNPIALLLFPHLGFLSKIRFGLQVFLSIRRKNWDKLDRVSALRWIKDFTGEKTYEVLWESLLDLKFHRYKDRLSAAWVGRRLKRVGLSRKNILTEELAYLEGGVEVLLDALTARIKELGGRIFLNAEVTRISRGKETLSLAVDDRELSFDKVLSTMPLPYIPRMVPGLPGGVLEKYKQLENIGVVCVILKLTGSLTENFWLNISDPEIALPGIIEFSNIRPLPDKVVYFPFYLPRDHGNFSKSDDYFLAEVKAYCKKINPNFEENWVLAAGVHRYEYAQPVCPPGFLGMLPPIETGLEGFYAVDTSYYYPEDRSISESILMGKGAANLLLGDKKLQQEGQKKYVTLMRLKTAKR